MLRLREIAHEFRLFILKGNVVDLAVGVVIGAAFGKVVDSMVKDIITPLIGLFGGEHDFSSLHWGPVHIGNFVNAILGFLVLAAVVFFLVVKPVNALTALARKRAEAQPTAPTPLPDDVRLLMEIRDLLKGGALGVPTKATPARLDPAPPGEFV